ncbi:MAG: VWA domain-containing protein [Deltaproteobacteria bacterium]|nr:VWA domain-containing protein [Deltaproteobacteria bacterium]
MRIARLFLAATTLLVAPACTEVSTPEGGAEADGGIAAPPPADAGECRNVVDVVFVLDTSSSMGFVLDTLEADITGVVDAANGLAADAHFGLVVFQDNFKLDDSGDQGTVHTSAATLESAFAYYQSTFTDADRNPGDGPSGPTTQNPLCEENSLDALYAAANDFPWRDQATRVIILATDDTFLEEPDNYGDRDGDGDTTSPSFPSEGDYPALRAMDETVAQLKALDIRVFSFSRLQEPGPFDFTKCGTPRRLPWSSVSDGWSTPYQGKAPIPEQTDGSNFDLDAVKGGQLELAETISQVVVESYCSPPVQ